MCVVFHTYSNRFWVTWSGTGNINSRTIRWLGILSSLAGCDLSKLKWQMNCNALIFLAERWCVNMCFMFKYYNASEQRTYVILLVLLILLFVVFYIWTNVVRENINKLTNIDASAVVTDFPVLSENHLQYLTFGWYQIKQTWTFRTLEYLDEDGGDIFVGKTMPNIIQVRIQSIHVSSKSYSSVGTIRFWERIISNKILILSM